MTVSNRSEFDISVKDSRGFVIIPYKKTLFAVQSKYTKISC